MEANCNNLPERILQLTLEIIYLLTGEDDIVAKKASGDGQNSITVPLHSLLIPKGNNEQKILEVTQQIIDLLMRESGNWRHFNVRIKEEIKEVKEEDVVMQEREYLGHKDLYKNVMMENRPPLTSPDGSSNRNPPKRRPRPMYAQDSTQEHQEIPQEDRVGGSSNRNPPKRRPHPLYSRDSTQEHQQIPQEDQIDESSIRNPPKIRFHHLYALDATQEDLTILHHDQDEEVMGIKIVVQEEEEMHVDGQLPRKEDEMVTIAEGGSTLDVSTGGHSAWITPEGRLILSAHYNKDNNGMVQYSSADFERSFINNHDLVVPQGTLIMEKPFSCFKCQKTFLRKSGLVQHLRLHTGQKPFICSVCGKAFTEKSQLNRHNRVHTGEKPFPCPECGKCFNDKGNRDKHLRIHTGEKPFCCSECGKCFAQKSSLIIHHRMHNT